MPFLRALIQRAPGSPKRLERSARGRLKGNEFSAPPWSFKNLASHQHIPSPMGETPQPRDYNPRAQPAPEATMYPILFEIPVLSFNILAAGLAAVIALQVAAEVWSRRTRQQSLASGHLWITVSAIVIGALFHNGFPVRAFGVMVVIGMLVGAEILARLAKRYAKEEELPGYAAMPLWVMIGVLVGARALYVAVEVLQGSGVGQEYNDNIFKVFAFWEGGLVMYGGALGGIVAGVWCARKYKVAVANTLDIGVVAAYVGLGLGRIGCLLVGDDYGSIVPAGSNPPFPIALRVPEVLAEHSLFGAENAGQLLYATQIWMSVDAFLLAAIGFMLLKFRRYEGQVALIVLLLYAGARSFIESYRGDGVRGLWFDGALSTSQVISIVVAALCVGLLGMNHFKRRPQPEPGAPA
jgi:phosphatidylglycerol:prolipoprotein diacylglycerol transferase